jgi:hypothetical protein
MRLIFQNARAVACFAAAVLALASADSVFGRTTEPAMDPAILSLSSGPPDFRQHFTGPDWNSRLAKALSDLGGLGALTKSNQAASGSRIYLMDDHGQAKDLKLAVGEVITKIDECPVDQRPINSMRRDADQSFTLVSPEGRSRMVTIHPGHIGIDSIPIVRAELLYMRHGQRNARWDALAAVGAADCDTQPDVAETAWHDAIQAGYVPDFLSDFCGMRIAWEQGRMSDAVAFCESMDARPEKFPGISKEPWISQLALSDFKIEQALAFRMAPHPAEALPNVPYSDHLRHLLAMHRALPDAQRLAADPSQVAASAVSDLLPAVTAGLDTSDAEMDKWRKAALAYIQAYRHLGVTVQGNHAVDVQGIPRVDAANVQLTLKVNLSTPTPAFNYTHFFYAMLIDCSGPDRFTAQNHPAILIVMIYLPGEIWAEHVTPFVPLVNNIVPVESDVRRASGFTLRLLHVRGREEVWINQRRVFYLPAESNPSRVGFLFGASGLTADAQVRFDRIELH